jgi:hypothetical protein
MSKDITKEDYINYLVDSKGYSEEEARVLFSSYGVKCIEEEDKVEFYSFIS